MAAHKGRTFLVVASVSIGVFAVGMIAGTQVLLAEGLSESYQASRPASATVYTVDSFDDEFVESVARMPGVAVAQGRRSVTVRERIEADAYRDLQLTAVPDFESIRARIVRHESGAWPPPARSILVERSAVDMMGVAEGDTIEVKTPSGRTRELAIAGVAYDASQPPAFIEGVPYGYMTFETMEWLGEPRSFNELDIVAAERTDDFEHVRLVAETVRDKVEKSGKRVFFLFVPEPGRHPLDSIVQTVLLLLGSLGGLAVVLSGFLVVNTVVALLGHQTRHIGIMKAVGARRGQIGAMYVAMVLGYGALSILVALPLGAVGAFGLAQFMAGKLNVDLPPGGFPAEVILAQVAVALIVPVAAAALPVSAGTRISVREALASYGLGKGHFGESRIDRWLKRIGHLPRPTLLSLRNTFRRKMRLFLTLVTLTLAGAAFIAVFAVRASMLHTLDHVLDLWQYHVLVSLDQPYRAERVIEAALATDGVASAEAWGFSGVRFLHDDDTESDAVFLFATPADTKYLVPDVIAGRWLQTSDENALVMNTKAQHEAGGAEVGDEVTLSIEGDDRPFRVAGIVKSPGPDAMAYVNYPYFGEITNSVGRATSVLVVANDPSKQGQLRVAANLERNFKDSGLRVASVLRISGEIEEAEASFGILVVLLLIMAILLAVVGGLGLAGAMSLNVIERTREIGVMRAIGAARRHIMSIVLTEGLVIGALSAILGAFLAIPLGRALSDAVGRTFMESPLIFTYPWHGLVLWFTVALVVAVIASALPAWNAARISVREALAYE